MFELRLRHANHVRRYSISAVAPSGWEVRCEEDSTVTRQDIYVDWHRVERAQASFKREAMQLTERGWFVV